LAERPLAFGDPILSQQIFALPVASEARLLGAPFVAELGVSDSVTGVAAAMDRPSELSAGISGALRTGGLKIHFGVIF
jgi:hypothetical protein